MLLRGVCVLALVGICSGIVDVQDGWRTFKGDVQHTGYIKGASLPTNPLTLSAAGLSLTNTQASPVYSPQTGLAYFPSNVHMSAVHIHEAGTTTVSKDFGKEMWTTPHPSSSSPSLSSDGSTIYYGDSTYTVYSADATTGHANWNTKLGGDLVGSVVHYYDWVLASTVNAGDDTSHFQVLNRTNGDVLMKCSVGTKVLFGATLSDSNGGSAYVVTLGKDLFAFTLPGIGACGSSCSSCATWSIQDAGGSIGLGLIPSGPPSIDSNTKSMWITTQPNTAGKSKLLCIDLGSTQPASTMQVVAYIPGSCQTTATPVSTSGDSKKLTVITVANPTDAQDPNVIAYSVDMNSVNTTSIKWQVNARQGDIESPAITDGSTVIVPVKEYIVGLSFGSGSKLFSIKAGTGPIAAGIAIAQNGHLISTDIYGDIMLIGNQQEETKESSTKKMFWDGWHKFASIGGAVLLLGFCGLFCFNLCSKRKTKRDEMTDPSASDSILARGDDDEIIEGTYSSLANEP